MKVIHQWEILGRGYFESHPENGWGAGCEPDNSLKPKLHILWQQTRRNGRVYVGHLYRYEGLTFEKMFGNLVFCDN